MGGWRDKIKFPFKHFKNTNGNEAGRFQPDRMIHITVSFVLTEASELLDQRGCLNMFRFLWLLGHLQQWLRTQLFPIIKILQLCWRPIVSLLPEVKSTSFVVYTKLVQQRNILFISSPPLPSEIFVSTEANIWLEEVYETNKYELIYHWRFKAKPFPPLKLY